MLATGYESGAGHLPEDVVPRTAGGDLDLFLGAFPRGRDDLVVLGQQRVAGGALPVLVEQADVAAYVLAATLEDSSSALRRVPAAAGRIRERRAREPDSLGRGVGVRVASAACSARRR